MSLVRKHLLFDLDGTLLDTAKDFSAVLNYQLIKHGREEVAEQHVRETVSDGARALIKLGFSIDESDQDFSTYLEELLNLYANKIPSSEAVLFPGIEELLSLLDKNNLAWGIVTNKPSRFTTPLLKQFNIFQSSAVVVCADQVSQSKPSPEGILLACQTLNRKPNECIYVGDHKRDIDAGKNANMETIAVTWGYVPKTVRLEDWQPDHIVNTSQEIADHLFGN